MERKLLIVKSLGLNIYRIVVLNLICLHSGEKTLHCESCDAKFSLNFDLKSHTSTHTGDKPFRCEICGTKFSRNSHLKRHIK